MRSFLSLTKWRLFLTVLPLTFLFALGKVGMHYLGWEPWVFDSLTGALFGSATFVLIAGKAIDICIVRDKLNRSLNILVNFKQMISRNGFKVFLLDDWGF